jgi:hypothetical protein
MGDGTINQGMREPTPKISFLFLVTFTITYFMHVTVQSSHLRTSESHVTFMHLFSILVCFGLDVGCTSF